MSTVDLLRTFVEETFLDGAPGGDDPLKRLELDSLAIEQVVEFVEEKLGIRFRDEELAPEDFESIYTIAARADAKLGPAQTR